MDEVGGPVQRVQECGVMQQEIVLGIRYNRMQRPVGDTELRAYSTPAGVLFLKSELEFILTFRWATLATIIIPII